MVTRAPREPAAVPAHIQTRLEAAGLRRARGDAVRCRCAISAAHQQSRRFGRAVAQIGFEHQAQRSVGWQGRIGAVGAQPGEGAFDRADVLAMKRLPIRAGRQVVELGRIYSEPNRGSMFYELS